MTNTDIIKEKIEDSPTQVENCDICGVPTEYKRFVPIDFRNYYVEGAGQLCKGCYEDTYGKWRY